MSHIFAFLTPKRSLEHVLSAPDHALCIRLGQGPWSEVSAFVAQFGNVNTLQAEHQCKLPAMMQVVGHDTPDGPLACYRIDLALSDVPIGLCQIGR
ncbi:MAG: hypothetical protein ABI456_06975, partial [Ktedonobacteraceae bacterium]